MHMLLSITNCNLICNPVSLFADCENPVGAQCALHTYCMLDDIIGTVWLPYSVSCPIHTMYFISLHYGWCKQWSFIQRRHVTYSLQIKTKIAFKVQPTSIQFLLLCVIQLVTISCIKAKYVNENCFIYISAIGWWPGELSSSLLNTTYCESRKRCKKWIHWHRSVYFMEILIW